MATENFKDLVDIKKWQEIQDNFSAVTEVGLRTVDAEGNPITSWGTEPRLCSQVLKSSPQNRICATCLPTFLGGEALISKNHSFVCQASLHNFIVPLRLRQSKVLGYVILGPVILVMRKSKEEYQKVAEELNVDLEDFWSALLEIKVISFHGMQSLVKLIKDIGEYTINLAYRGIAKEKEVVMKLDSSKLAKLLEVLLDVAFEVSQADIGSVMFLDERQENLTIHASRGIPNEVVRRTKVRLGEGISGIAAKQGRPFVIDENLREAEILPYLRRPYLRSSMVLPIKVEKRVVGVMNLGALQTSPVRFNMDKAQLMNKLIGLVSTAIS